MEVTISLADIDTWDTGVSVGTDFKFDLDRTHLNLGILVNHLCPIRKAGKPLKENKAQTVTALAKAISIDRVWLSNAASNARFFDGVYDKIPPQASIQDLNKGRRLSGWSPGADRDPFKYEMKIAMAYLEGQVDEQPKEDPTAISYVRGARGKLAKALEHETPLEAHEVTIVEKAKDGLDEVDSHYETEEDDE